MDATGIADRTSRVIVLPRPRKESRPAQTYGFPSTTQAYNAFKNR